MISRPGLISADRSGYRSSVSKKTGCRRGNVMFKVKSEEYCKLHISFRIWGVRINTIKLICRKLDIIEANIVTSLLVNREIRDSHYLRFNLKLRNLMSVYHLIGLKLKSLL